MGFDFMNISQILSLTAFIITLSQGDQNPAFADSPSRHTSCFPGLRSRTWWAVSTSSSRSIRRCTISIQQIDARQRHVVRKVWKGAQRADLPPDQNLHFVFAFTLCCDKWPSSRWWIHAANITLGAEKEITVVLHEKLFHNNVKFLHKEYWTVECLWHCYRPRTALCWAACAVFSSPVSYSAQVFASFFACAAADWEASCGTCMR